MAKYPDSTKHSLEYRLHARARERWPQLTTVEVRHRGTFSPDPPVGLSGLLGNDHAGAA